jgi:uncharacterized protein
LKRLLQSQIISDLYRKMVFLAGPRQVGKTSLAKSIMTREDYYLNWDFTEDRESILLNKWPVGKALLVLDEIHKYPEWRNTVKGLFDKRREELRILVTGSARLEYYSYGGDSLQGRYFLHHLNPLTVRELNISTMDDFNQLLNLSGFPEPFLSGSLVERNRWSRNYRTLLVREDIRDLENIHDLAKIEKLSLRLPELVASPLSLNTLREDLEVAHQTVSTWCDILERLYYMFRIYPFGNSKIKANKKQPKHYHYDWALVTDPGARLENLLAMHLLSWCQSQQDIHGRDISLNYYRDAEKREVDFILSENEKPFRAIECKTGSKDIDTGIKYFKKKFPDVECIQLELQNKKSYQSPEGIKVLPLLDYLKDL